MCECEFWPWTRGQKRECMISQILVKEHSLRDLGLGHVGGRSCRVQGSASFLSWVWIMKHRLKGLSSPGQGKCGSSVVWCWLWVQQMRSLTAFRHAALVISFLNYSMLFARAAGQAWFTRKCIYTENKTQIQVQRAHIWWRLLHKSSQGYTINVSPYVYRQVIYDPIDLSLEIDFVFLEWSSARFSCPLIDPILWQQGCPLLQQLYLGVLCSLFDVQYWALDCYYQLRSPIPPFPYV